MKKILFLLAMLPMMWACSSSGDDEPEAPGLKKEVEVFNIIDKSEVSTKTTDGNLYSVYAVKSDGKYILVGDIQNGQSKKFEIPKDSKTDKFSIAFQFGASKEKAIKSNIVVLSSKSTNKVLWFTATTEDVLDVYISEESYLRSSNYNNMGDLITSILGNL